MRKFSLIIILALIAVIGVVPNFAQEDTMHIRVAHFSVDAPAVDIYVNGDVAIESLAFPDVTDWVELAEGEYDIAVAPAGTSLDDAVIGPATFNLVSGTWITVAAIGSVEAGTLAPNVLVEDYAALPDDGFARISVAHAIEGAPAVNIEADGTTLISSLAYPGTQGSNDGFFIRSVPAGSADISVVLTSDTDTTVLSASDVEFEVDMNYFIAAVGTPTDPQLVVVATAMGDSMMMDDDEMMGDEMMSNTIADIVVASTEADEPQFTVLLAAVSAADPAILEALSNPDASLTVFAPTDEAFVTLLEAMETDAETLLADTELLNSVLQYHVLDGAVMAETVLTLDGESVPTLLGEDQTITISVSDAGVMLNESINVITTDIEADNGVIHVIDSVLLPMTSMEDDSMDASDEMMSNTIADIVVASSEADDPQFKVLLAAVSVADPSILEALSNPDVSLTVFAPTDEAFVALLEALGMDAETLFANTDLVNSVLQYHVLDGAVMAETVLTLDGESVPTLLGEDATISISVSDEGVVLNESINVVSTDIIADNGVIHVIDAVLVPETE